MSNWSTLSWCWLLWVIDKFINRTRWWDLSFQGCYISSWYLYLFIDVGHILYSVANWFSVIITIRNHKVCFFNINKLFFSVTPKNNQFFIEKGGRATRHQWFISTDFWNISFHTYLISVLQILDYLVYMD
jgi:hypothetical protein